MAMKINSRTKWNWNNPRFNGVADPNKVGWEVEQIRRHCRQQGIPFDVGPGLEFASDPSTELHKLIYSKDDTEAALLWREERMRLVYRSLRVVVKDPNAGEDKLMRFLIHIRPGSKEGYAAVSEVTEQDMAEQVMQEALDQLRNWIGRYSELASQLPGVFRAIRLVLGKKK
jgi:hypothetical protein